MTKKEKEILKNEYKNVIFDTWYQFYKMKMSRTQENEDSYNRKIHIVIEFERILQALKINPEELLSENERNYIHKVAMETATK